MDARVDSGPRRLPVMVAARADDVERLAGELTRVGLVDASIEPGRRGRLIVRAHASSPDHARRALRDLRAAGWRAVEGPPSAGHELGWARRTEPVWFAEDAAVCFPWSRFEAPARTTVVEIDPAGGFGAGGHPSTRLLLETLAARRPIGEVLDVGCGSGVLAIAAALLGADMVRAIDVSATAVAATRANAWWNGVDHIEVSTDALDHVRATFDIVLANIHAGILVDLAPDLVRRLVPTGWLGVSGISRAQVSQVAASLAPLTIASVAHRDDWVALVATREQTVPVPEDTGTERSC